MRRSFSGKLEEEVEAGDARVFLEFAQDPRPRRLRGAPYPPGPLMAALNEADGADRTELLLARLADGGRRPIRADRGARL